VSALTGKTRYREHKRWFKSSLLVLQVEVPVYDHTDTPGDSMWRDATVADLVALEMSSKVRVMKIERERQ
jgi:hypothetical protein